MRIGICFLSIIHLVIDFVLAEQEKCVLFHTFVGKISSLSI